MGAGMFTVFELPSMYTTCIDSKFIPLLSLWLSPKGVRVPEAFFHHRIYPSFFRQNRRPNSYGRRNAFSAHPNGVWKYALRVHWILRSSPTTFRKETRRFSLLSVIYFVFLFYNKTLSCDLILSKVHLEFVRCCRRFSWAGLLSYLKRLRGWALMMVTKRNVWKHGWKLLNCWFEFFGVLFHQNNCRVI